MQEEAAHGRNRCKKDGQQMEAARAWARKSAKGTIQAHLQMEAARASASGTVQANVAMPKKRPISRVNNKETEKKQPRSYSSQSWLDKP